MTNSERINILKEWANEHGTNVGIKEDPDELEIICQFDCMILSVRIADFEYLLNDIDSCVISSELDIKAKNNYFIVMLTCRF